MRNARSTALRVPVFGQGESDCGPTSLKAVCRFHGKRYSARALARLAGGAIDGVDHARLIRAARLTGAHVFSKAEGTLGELAWFVSNGLPVIVGWWSQEQGDVPFDTKWSLAERRRGDCGHYSVVCGVTKNRVLLMDPQWEHPSTGWRIVGMRSLSRRHFLRVWYDTDTKQLRRVDRWYMVVHYDPQLFEKR